MILPVITIFFIVSLLSIIRRGDKGGDAVIIFVIGVAMVLIAGLRPPGIDYANYLDMYKLAKYGFDIRQEPSFSIIAGLSSSYHMMFIIYALIGVSLKLVAIRQLTPLVYLSIAMYCSYYFILHDMIQIRAAVASGMLLLCIKPIYDRNWMRFLLYAFIAILFHYSALLTLPLWFLSRRLNSKILYLSIPIGYLFFFSGYDVTYILSLIPIPFVASAIEIYTNAIDAGQFDTINVFNMVYLAKIAIFYLLIWKRQLLESRNSYTNILINMYALSLMSFTFFASMPILAFRVSELLGIVEIILLPMVYYIFKDQRMSSIIATSIAMILLLINIFHVGLI